MESRESESRSFVHITRLKKRLIIRHLFASWHGIPRIDSQVSRENKKNQKSKKGKKGPRLKVPRAAWTSKHAKLPIRVHRLGAVAGAKGSHEKNFGGCQSTLHATVLSRSSIYCANYVPMQCVKVVYGSRENVRNE